MKINLYHEKTISNLNTKFIYLGEKNYLYYKNKKFKNFIDISILLKKELNLQKNKFLKWIENQRVNNNDSKYWWMTNLAGKNNLGNNLILNLTKLKLLERLIDEKILNHDFDIICETYLSHKTSFTKERKRDNPIEFSMEKSDLNFQ